MLKKYDSKYSDMFKILCEKWPGFINLYRLGVFISYEFLYIIFRFKKINTFVSKNVLIEMKEGMKILKDDDRKHMFPQYSFGDIKPCLTNEYYLTIAKENTTLVPYGVKKLTSDGIMASNGKEYKVDCIVLATVNNFFFLLK